MCSGYKLTGAIQGGGPKVYPEPRLPVIHHPPKGVTGKPPPRELTQRVHPIPDVRVSSGWKSVLWTGRRHLPLARPLLEDGGNGGRRCPGRCFDLVSAHIYTMKNNGIWFKKEKHSRYCCSRPFTGVGKV